MTSLAVGNKDTPTVDGFTRFLRIFIRISSIVYLQTSIAYIQYGSTDWREPELKACNKYDIDVTLKLLQILKSPTPFNSWFSFARTIITLIFLKFGTGKNYHIFFKLNLLLLFFKCIKKSTNRRRLVPNAWRDNAS